MSEFTVNDQMAEIRYELDEREIYNDIRSEIGLVVSETVVDADPTYKWQYFNKWFMQMDPGDIDTALIIADYANATNWTLESHKAEYLYASQNPYVREYRPYYSYSIKFESVSSRMYKITVENTGSEICHINAVVKYKYLATERITHEEQVPLTLQVRAIDTDSIQKYGRRVMNLTWSEGTEQTAMQTLVDAYLEKYKEPVARLTVTIKGSNDTLREQIVKREISDLLTVVCTELGLNDDCYINSIKIEDDMAGIPVCTWGLELQRATEALGLFTLDTSELDGPDILG
jgi:hypothetical protein